jgi:arylformamidase
LEVTMTTYIDLTMPISPDMRMNPDHFKPDFQPYASIEADGFAATRLVLSSHTGTHMDAPGHFVEGGASIDEAPLEVVSGAAQVAHCTVGEVNRSIEPNDIGQIDALRLLIHTGWSELELDEATYFGAHPFLSAAAVEHILAAGVRLVGIDSPSVDYHPPSEVHLALLGAGIYLVENLVNLSKLPGSCMFTALPLPLVGADGCPVRAFGVFEEGTLE